MCIGRSDGAPRYLAPAPGCAVCVDVMLAILFMAGLVRTDRRCGTVDLAH